jgi:hypothetical protein
MKKAFIITSSIVVCILGAIFYISTQEDICPGALKPRYSYTGADFVFSGCYRPAPDAGTACESATECRSNVCQPVEKNRTIIEACAQDQKRGISCYLPGTCSDGANVAGWMIKEDRTLEQIILF